MVPNEHDPLLGVVRLSVDNRHLLRQSSGAIGRADECKLPLVASHIKEMKG